MTTQEQLEVFEAKQEEAKALSATYPQCGADCDVHAQFKQATRREPMEFLGFGAYCMGDCFGPFVGGQYFTPTLLQSRLES
jgi:hypothetical protein